MLIGVCVQCLNNDGNLINRTVYTVTVALVLCSDQLHIGGQLRAPHTTT